MAKILVIDDDVVLGRLYKSALENEGHEVDMAVDGEEGLQKVKEQKPSFILTDIMMPRMDGQEALKRIRTEEHSRGILPAKEVPIVMTTVLEDPKNVIEAYFKGGATAYLVKPVDRIKLRSTLGKLGIKPMAKTAY